MQLKSKLRQPEKKNKKNSQTAIITRIMILWNYNKEIIKKAVSDTMSWWKSYLINRKIHQQAALREMTAEKSLLH